MSRINWPEKNDLKDLDEFECDSPEPHVMVGWNKAVDACKMAEKLSRLNVEEIERVIKITSFAIGESDYEASLARSIHKAVYGEE